MAVGVAAAVTALGTTGAGAGEDRSPTRAALSGEGSGHLPAYRGAERPPLVSTPTSSAAAVPAPPVFSPGPAAPAPPPATPPAPTPPDPGAGAALGVDEDDDPTYFTRLSRTLLRAGDVTVELRNLGDDPHNLLIIRDDGAGTPVVFDTLEPKETVTRTVRFAASTYRLSCTLYDHDELGMNATLTVTAG